MRAAAIRRILGRLHFHAGEGELGITSVFLRGLDQRAHLNRELRFGERASKSWGKYLLPGVQWAISPVSPWQEDGPMRFKVQLVVCAEDGQEDTVHEITVLEKGCHRIEHLGLRACLKRFML